MTRLRAIFLVSSSLACAAAVLVACSDDAERLPYVESAPDTGAAPEASLPPPSETTDGGADVVTPPVQRPPFDPADVPVTCAAEPCAVALVAGESHFCARMNDGTVRCWGDNSRGAIGTGIDGGTAAGFPPTPVVGLEGVTQLSAAEYTTCAVASGAVQCWGGNRQGQLGLQASPALTDFLRHPSPAPVDLAASVARVDVGHRSVCALTTANDLACWGGNDKLQLTRVDAGAAGGPGPADLHTFDVTRTTASQTTVFGIGGDGRLLTWGQVSGRESSIAIDPVPAPLETLTKVTSVAAGPAHTCVVADGELYCWGSGTRGALGSGTPNDERLPSLAKIENTVDQKLYPQQVAVSANITCVRITDGTIQCAGDDSRGAFGTGKASTLSAFLTTASAFTGYAVHVATSNLATCALLRTGQVQCWGGNTYGELGQGTKDTNPHPVPVTVTF